MDSFVELTGAAREKAKEFLAQEKGANLAVRIMADDHGKLLLSIDERSPQDRSTEVDGVPIVVEGALFELVRGLRIDYDGQKQAFSFGGSARALSEPAALESAVRTHKARAAHGGGHPTPNYMRVFWYLLILTIVEVLVAYLPDWFGFPIVPMRMMLVVLAVWKAALVAMFFMHLKFEGRWKYVAVVPPAILATILVFLLMPDIGYPGWQWPR
jgi:cytochrome c oxidase subunit 4